VYLRLDCLTKHMKLLKHLSLFGCICTVVPLAGAQSPSLPSKAPAPVWYVSDRQHLDRELDAVFWFKNQFIALGREMQRGGLVGVVARSTEGYEWNFSYPADAPKTEIFSAANSDNMLVVLPWDRISFLISTDGAQWNKVGMPRNMLNGEQAMVYSVIFGNQEFIAVGQGGTILGSADGKTWELRRRAQRGEPHLWSVAWNGKNYLSPYGKDKVLMSSDGRDWKVVQTPGVPDTGVVGWVSKKFLIVNGDAGQLESADGLSWSKKINDFGCAPDGWLDIRKIFQARNTLVVLGRCMEKTTGTHYSPRGLFAISNDDGVSWINMARDTYMRDIAYSPELKRFQAAGHKRFPNAGAPYLVEAFARGE
jgi:hypothetical protein